jgi:tetratricopeptide (TPR) repeat protein
MPDPISAVLLFVAKQALGKLVGNVAVEAWNKLKGDPAQKAFATALGDAINRYAYSGIEGAATTRFHLARPLSQEENNPLKDKEVTTELAKILKFDAKEKPDPALIGKRWKASVPEPPDWINFTDEAERLLQELKSALRDTDVYREAFDTEDLKQIREDATMVVEKLNEASSRLAALRADVSEIAKQGRGAMERIQELSRRLAVSESAVSTFFRMIGKSHVPESDVGIEFIETATRYKVLEQQTELLKGADPQMQRIRAEVEFALAQGDLDLADTMLVSAVRQIKGVEQLRDGRVADALKSLQEAAAFLEPRVKANPNHSGLNLQIGYILKTRGDALRSQNSAQAENLLREALERFRFVVNEIPSGQKTVADLANAMNGIANISYIRGDAKSAIKCGERATSLEPTYAYAWHDLLLAYMALAKEGDVQIEKMRDALEHLRRTSTGLPGLSEDHLASLAQRVQTFVDPNAAVGHRD